ncbi:MAG TPA: 16S rRNA (cytidine(1402)-2'-O)-methyltransferase [Candidatus Binatia bacterium]|nr:16S rRNA (cytidine(1402)-2'-O)-methyltransferase [Candidatus Binatia bacterium]
MLYVVATPIGNLEDLTLRALRILKEADLIAAEDTRHTRKLLSHYGITTPLTSYYDQIETSKAPALIEQLRAGKTIALVSDAGTPGIADPGYRLVKGAAEAGIAVVPIPGPSTLTALLSVGGLPMDRFVFEGFLPAKKSRRQSTLHRLRQEERTLIFFESPHRLLDLLADLDEIFGDRQVVIGRELTKMFEETLRGSVRELRTSLQGREIKGEVALLVAGRSAADEPQESLSLAAEIRLLEVEGLSLKEIAQIISEQYGLPKREIYAMGVRLREGKAK